MRIPFKILPTEGYINSDFQIISYQDNIKVELFLGDELVTEVTAHSDASILIRHFKKAGNYVAKAFVNGEEFVQNLKVRDAYRLGSSVFSKAFVFDASPITFISMKDRLLIHNSTNNLLLPENLYNPTEICFLKDNLFLFITRLGNNINLGIYDAELFTLVADLRGNIEEIYINSDNTVFWLYDKNQKSISCYRINFSESVVFKKIKSFKNISKFHLNNYENVLIVEDTKNIIHIQNIENLSQYKFIVKSADNAVDFLGYIYERQEDKLLASNVKLEKVYKADFKSSEIRFMQSDFFHLGESLIYESKANELLNLVKDISKKFLEVNNDDNKFVSYKLNDEEKVTNADCWYKVYPTNTGFLLQKTSVKNVVDRISFKKVGDDWLETTSATRFYSYQLLSCPNDGAQNAIFYDNTIVRFKNIETIIITTNTKDYFFYNNKLNPFLPGERFDSFLPGSNNYWLTVEGDIVKLRNAHKSFFKTKKILNRGTILEVGKIWFVKEIITPTHVIKKITYFDINLGIEVPFSNSNIEFNSDENFLRFEHHYGISENNFLFNPAKGTILAPFIGELQAISTHLSKIVVMRDQELFLGIFDYNTENYNLYRLSLQSEQYQESYISPNGKFLVLSKEPGKFEYYDMEKNEVVNFFNGIFLKFSTDGNLVFEEDKTRKARIIDPITMQDITPSNYNYYKFTSPDGKLVVDLKTTDKYYNKIIERYATPEEVKYWSTLFGISFFVNFNPKIQSKYIKDIFLENFFLENIDKFNTYGISKLTDVRANHILQKHQFVNVMAIDGSFSAEILLPFDMQFFNYAAFSYDNRYFACVGKKSFNGFLSIHKLNMNSSEMLVDTSSEIFTDDTNKAAWICGFSKNGQFATYDSIPTTYIYSLSKGADKNSIAKNSEIHGKNFLSFSPSGKFLAMSEQGYNPISMGGGGHQISSAIHIADENAQIIQSFGDHGAEIKHDISKKVCYAFFSEDETKIMSLSKDGVVIIRNILVNDTPINNNVNGIEEHNVKVKEENLQ